MGSTTQSDELKALHFPFEDPKFIFFTDFDGTITERDSNDYMTDNIGFGTAERKQGNKDVLEDKKTFRQSFREMMDSITAPYNECIDLLVKNITLDPGFKEYFEWSLENKIPTVVVSSGMEPIIRAILQNLIGKDADKLDIISNDVEARPGKTINEKSGWQIKFHDDSDFGHDKSLCLRPYSTLPKDKRPTMFYAGDGVSDLSAARETDLLFAKKGHDLISYCARENVPFTVFGDWTDILREVKRITAGETTVEQAAKEGYEQFKKGDAGVSA
ncbi:unnamed protein product [Zymoseptoria tritici ST99CH_1A5]|uniref:Phosphoserine phosphatase n=3 Tax=Zymoseptoria tritici TaxID=1047171 RepID=F9XJ41_ZYMTI|nr:uncharacterized protein MYCGRDRAFT_75334 [Zymoseptoria tritici IPO323]EGP84282.1 hypothetical protein MYCGRDRAFT_75334 [Zymoseptoria tritici IPO323]SMQ53864.1 unnamed protein product [Zymoseptoria tritici ST99CH_3D7]SMY27502.1 unnamed protein product [Zymoseptoria tritici ST99CH_1A5]